MNWLEALKASNKSLAELSALLGYSRTAISQVKNGVYPSPTDGIAAAVREKLQPATVHCSVIGSEISFEACLQHQQTKASTSSPMRLALTKACPGCKHNRRCMK